jgi:hypothetical protein
LGGVNLYQEKKGGGMETKISQACAHLIYKKPKRRVMDKLIEGKWYRDGDNFIKYLGERPNMCGSYSIVCDAIHMDEGLRVRKNISTYHVDSPYCKFLKPLALILLAHGFTLERKKQIYKLIGDQILFELTKGEWFYAVDQRMSGFTIHALPEG